MRTILTKKEQSEWLSENWKLTALTTHHSNTGMSHYLKNARNEKIHTVTGCGFDVVGCLFADFIMANFEKEVYRLVKRLKWTGRKEYQCTEKFYGMHYNKKTGKVTIDGACGINQVERILNAIGFTKRFICDTSTGCTFSIIPVTNWQKSRL